MFITRKTATFLLLLSAAGLAFSQEPVLSWKVQRMDSEGTPLLPEFQKSNLDAANLQARTLCDSGLAARSGWPTASAVLVTVTPLNASKGDKRKRVATVQCSEYINDPLALEKHISRPKVKAPPEKKMIHLWD